MFDCGVSYTLELEEDSANELFTQITCRNIATTYDNDYRPLVLIDGSKVSFITLEYI